MALTQHFDEIKQSVDMFLTDYLSAKIGEFEQIDPVMATLAQNLADQITRSGKRIRPLLAMLGYTISQGNDPKLALHLAATLELLHQYFMIHDDIVDRDEKRYQGDALHVLYAKHFSSAYGKNDPHLGLSLGMIGGDLANTLANELLWELSTDDKTKQAIGRLFYQTIYETMTGWQIHFFTNQEPVAKVSESTFLRGMELVSARYTFQAPLAAGVLLSKNNQYAKLLNTYAHHTGMAFQIRDDVLGMFGDSARMGKPVGNDYREGKKTLLVLHSYQRANTKQKRFIESTLGTPIDQTTFSQVKNLLVELGAVAYCEEMARHHTALAQQALSSLPFSAEKESLLELSDFVLQRTH